MNHWKVATSYKESLKMIRHCITQHHLLILLDITTISYKEPLRRGWGATRYCPSPEIKYMKNCIKETKRVLSVCVEDGVCMCTCARVKCWPTSVIEFKRLIQKPGKGRKKINKKCGAKSKELHEKQSKCMCGRLKCQCELKFCLIDWLTFKGWATTMS